MGLSGVRNLRQFTVPVLRAQSTDSGNFTIEELQSALSRLRPNKAPGPDEAVNELFLLLDDHNQLSLLQFYNDIWHKGEVPPDWKQAIVRIRCGPRQLPPYHPQTCCYTRGGSPQKRSTASVPLKARRTHFSYYAAPWNNSTHLLFLDWKQAFESIDHNAMITALNRFGVSQKALDTQSIYKDPIFYTRNFTGQQEEGRVGSGIRQGCPLSPYLFIMVLTVIMEDVDYTIASQGIATNTWSIGKPIYDLEYADDTLLISLTTTQMQTCLTAIETQASFCGMSLNQEKTELLIDTRKPPVTLRFSGGEEVPTTTQIKYLGSMIAWDRPFEAAFRHRAGIAESSYKKLRLIWNSRLSRREKLNIFQLVFTSTLIYGLDSLTLTERQLHRIDAYHFRFLRRIINMKASFYSRIPNTEVWRRAGYPQRPSDILCKLQYKRMSQVFQCQLPGPSASRSL